MTIKIAPLFFVGTKNKEHFYNFIFINFWVKSELRGFLQSHKNINALERGDPCKKSKNKFSRKSKNKNKDMN
jgi:hypothetical protein